MLEFIKRYWLNVALIIFGAIYACIKVAHLEWADAIFAIAFSIVAATSLLNKIEYDLKCEDYDDLLLDYVKELRQRIDLVEKQKVFVKGILDDVDKIEKATKAPAKKKSTKKS